MCGITFTILIRINLADQSINSIQLIDICNIYLGYGSFTYFTLQISLKCIQVHVNIFQFCHYGLLNRNKFIQLKDFFIQKPTFLLFFPIRCREIVCSNCMQNRSHLRSGPDTHFTHIFYQYRAFWLYISGNV